MTTLILLRHGHTFVDSSEPHISKWHLSETGRTEAERAATEPYFQDVDIIITSTESKAVETAQPLAEKLGKKIIADEKLCELDRDTGGFMEKDIYERVARECLTNPDISTHGWETASGALARVGNRIAELEREYAGKKILIVGHGYMLNMYMAKLAGTLDRITDILTTNTFCDWGVIQDGRIVKELGPTAERFGERLR